MAITSPARRSMSTAGRSCDSSGQWSAKAGRLTSLTTPFEEGPMSEKNDTFNPFDPTGMMKAMRDSSMDAWSKMMIQVVNTDAYAQGTAEMLDAWLSSSAPFRKAVEAAM